MNVMCIGLSLAAVLACGAPVPTEPIQGDAEAVSLAERMLDRLGGREAWARARSVKVSLQGYYAREAEPWSELYWMDLESPEGRFELSNESINRVVAWTREGGWETDAGERQPFPESRHAFEMEYWLRQPAVIFHRLARGGSATRVKMGTNEYRFDVFDAKTDELLVQFALNLKGEPTKWGAPIGDREFEHVFGPLESYDGIRFPRWGATIDGIWRYEHETFELSSTQIPVSLEPPTPE